MTVHRLTTDVAGRSFSYAAPVFLTCWVYILIKHFCLCYVLYNYLTCVLLNLASTQIRGPYNGAAETRHDTAKEESVITCTREMYA